MRPNLTANWVLKFLAMSLLLAAVPRSSVAQSGVTFSTLTPTYGTSGTTLSVFLPLENTGSAAASNVQITSATLGSAPLLTPALPLSIGTLAASDSVGLPLTFNSANLTAGRNYLLTVRGTYQSGPSTLGFSVNRFITLGQLSFFSAPAHPLSVNPTLDTAHGVTQMISAANGGTITATGADGSVFTLTIPSNALLADESITVTPLLTVSGLPISGGLVAGVQFAPEGLRFQSPATLTIQPGTTVPINQQVAFGYHASGNEFYFQPFGLTQAITIPILHFSGAGIGKGTAGNSGTPTSFEDRFDNAIAPIVAQERANLFPNDPPSDPTLLSMAVMLQATGLGVQAQASAALADDSLAMSAVALINNWLNQFNTFEPLFLNSTDPNVLSLAALLTSLDSTLLNLRSQVIEHAYNAAYNRCLGETSEDTRLGELAKMVWAYNEAQNLSLGGFLPAPVIVFPDYPQQLAACAAGPLTFSMNSTVNGTITIPSAQTVNSASAVSASGISLTFDQGGLQYMGSGPLNYDSRSYTIDWNLPEVSDCSSGVGNSGTIDVFATIDPNIDFSSVFVASQIRLQVTLVPQVSETDTTCATSNGAIGSATATDVYYDIFLDIANGGTGFNETTASSPYFVYLGIPATFNLSGTADQAALFSATEDTTITVSPVSP